MDSQASEVNRLSWKSIEAFEHAQSGMEHLVKTVKHRRDRKASAYSFLASLLIFLGVCYVIAGFLSDEGSSAGAGGATDNIAPHGPPKFMTPIVSP